MNSADLLTLSDYKAAYRSGGTTPARQVEEVYRRIRAYDDAAIFIALRPSEQVEADAQALEQHAPTELPLYGVPVAIKDNIDVAGIPTTAACPDFAYQPVADASAVARLRTAGALIIGKTNLDQFATGLVGIRSPYGAPRNPFSADVIPGGSSSGSAVAVAAGIVPLALGSDTAGSGRVPAGLNNIVGLKPTLGAVSTSGMVSACRSLDCVSIFALTVEDAFSALHAVGGYDSDDAFSKRIPLGRLGAVPPGLRIGIPDASGLSFRGDPEAQASFAAAISDLGRLGINAAAVDIRPLLESGGLLYEGPWVAERYQAIRNFLETRPHSLHPVTREIIAGASRFSAADAFAGLYRLAELRREAERIWREIDVLMVPTFPRPHSLDDLDRDHFGPNAELGTYTNFVNLLDLCAVAVPGRFRTDGLPSGVTLVAPAGQDALIASVATRLHAQAAVPLGATGRHRPSDASHQPHAAHGEIELAVVGAHLSGLPLNAELLGRGARFLRTVSTTADYRLFLLPGGNPPRPGLLRVNEGFGHAIETEVWALTAESFGSFVAGVPSPLAIGTVRLADGSAPKGFTVESAAVSGAEDISSHGGWRAFTRRRSA